MISLPNICSWTKQDIMNWCGGVKNRIQPRDKERKKLKLFFEKCKQEKLNLSRKSKDAVLSKDIGHLACVSNVHFNQKPELRSQTKSKAFNSLGGPFKKKNKSEILERGQVEFDCSIIKRVFLPPNHKNSFPASKLEFDDGVYDTINTNQANESQMQQESHVQQKQPDIEPKRKEFHQSIDNLPFIGENNTCSTYFCNQVEEAGPSYEVVEEATTSLLQPPPTTSYTVTDEFSASVREEGTGSSGWYVEENVNKITKFQRSMENSRIQQQPISPYNSRATHKMNMRGGDPYSRFDVFHQCSSHSSETELFQQQPDPPVECARKSPPVYLDADNDDDEQFVFQSRSLFTHKRGVASNFVDKKFDNPTYWPSEPPQEPTNQQEHHHLYDSSTSSRQAENNNLSFLNHQLVNGNHTATDDVTTTLDYARHTIQQQRDDHDKSVQSQRYVIPMMTSSFHDTSYKQQQQVDSRGSTQHNRSSSYESRRKFSESTERSSSSLSPVTEPTKKSSEECPSCDAKQKLLMTMLDSFLKDGSSKRRKDLSKMTKYFQLVSKLECCEHHNVTDSSDSEAELSLGSQSSLVGVHKPPPNTPGHSTTIVTMIDAACSPIKWPSYSVATSTTTVNINDSTAKLAGRAGQQRPLRHKHFTP